MANLGGKVISGATPMASFSTDEVNKMLEICEKHNVKELDTGHFYASITALSYHLSLTPCIAG